MENHFKKKNYGITKKFILPRSFICFSCRRSHYVSGNNESIYEENILTILPASLLSIQF